MVKWIFFDVGSTLVDETEAYDHRAREMIAGQTSHSESLTMFVSLLPVKDLTAILPP